MSGEIKRHQYCRTYITSLFVLLFNLFFNLLLLYCVSVHVLTCYSADVLCVQIFTMTCITGLRAVQKKTRDMHFDQALQLADRLGDYSLFIIRRCY